MRAFGLGLAASVALLSTFAPPAQAQTSLTPLDLASDAAMRDSARRKEFYETFAKTPLYIIVYDDRPLEAQGGGVVLPIRAGVLDGVPLINVFDTEDRLRAFAKAHELKSWTSVRLRGAATLRLLPSDYTLALNPDTGHQRLITSAEIKGVLAMPAGAGLPRTPVDVGLLKSLASAALEPPELVNALRQVLADHEEVRAAYVFRHPSPPPKAAGPAYLLALQLRSPTDEGAVVTAISQALKQRFTVTPVIDYTTATRSQLKRLAVGNLTPLYRAGKGSDADAEDSGSDEPEDAGAAVASSDGDDGVAEN